MFKSLQTRKRNKKTLNESQIKNQLALAVLLKGGIRIMTYRLPVILALFLYMSYTFAEETVSLKDAYDAAIKNTEFGAIQESQKIQADARVEKAGAAGFPFVSAKGSYAIQQATPTSSNPNDAASLSIGAVQPLYQGGIEGAGLEQAKFQRTSLELQLKSARLTLYSSIAHSFYDVSSAEKDKANLEIIIGKNKEIIKELEDRRSIGKSRNSEVLMAQSQLAVLQADYVGVLRTIDASRENFAFLTGLKKETGINSPEGDFSSLKELSFYLDKAGARPDVLALTADVEAAKREVTVLAAFGLPGVSLTGNYYPYRTGSNSGIYWDAGVWASFTLFDGGNTGAGVKEAINKQKETELTLSRKKKQAETEIKTAYENLKSLLEQIKALDAARDMTEKNYGEQKKDYEYSLVTNLDVLQAFNIFESTKRTYDKTKDDALAALADLMALSGLVEEK